MICGVKSRTSNCVLDRKDDKYGVWETLLTEWTTLLTWELIWTQLLLSPPFNLNFNISPVCHKSPFSILQREKLKVESLDMRKQSHPKRNVCPAQIICSVNLSLTSICCIIAQIILYFGQFVHLLLYCSLFCFFQWSQQLDQVGLGQTWGIFFMQSI